MKSLKIGMLGFLVAMCAITCIEPYEYDVPSVENQIFVDAELRDSFYFQDIKISYVQELDKQSFQGYSGAQVVVVDDLGESTPFLETNEGVYKGQFEAVRGREYHVEIVLNDGTNVISASQGVPQPVNMDSITFEELKETYVNEDGRNRTRDVLKFYGATSFDNTENDVYFRYGNFETAFLFQERKMVTFPPPKSCYVYNSNLTNEIDITKIPIGQDAINVRSLLFTKVINWELFTVFSAKVDAISMNLETYNYWKEIENVYYQDGSIENPPPAQVSSNLIVDGETIVLGHFAVVSAASAIRFVRGTDITTQIIPRCGVVGSYFPQPYPSECNECLLIDGSSTEKPSYW